MAQDTSNPSVWRAERWVPPHPVTSRDAWQASKGSWVMVLASATYAEVLAYVRAATAAGEVRRGLAVDPVMGHWREMRGFSGGFVQFMDVPTGT